MVVRRGEPTAADVALVDLTVTAVPVAERLRGAAPLSAVVDLAAAFTAPVFAAPVFPTLRLGAAVFAAPAFAEPVFAEPVFAAPVFAALVSPTAVFPAAVFAAPIFAARNVAGVVFVAAVPRFLGGAISRLSHSGRTPPRWLRYPLRPARR